MADSGKLHTALLGGIVLIAVASLVVAVMIYAALPGRPDTDIVADARRLAGELADNNLPEAAIEEYRTILDRGTLTDSQRGSIYYLIANLYFNDVGDYEKAAACYIRARSLDENASYAAEAGKNLITCLERMGRRLDARRELDRQVSLVPDSGQSPGKLVAKVGSRDITVADFNRAMESLPSDVRAKLSDKKEKRKFLDQVIGRELIYHAALREGLDKDPRMLTDLKELEKDYLVQFYTQQKIAPTVRPDSAELNLYFSANKDKYGDKKFEEIRDQVTQDYIGYIGQKAVNEYISSLLKAEPVQVFEENLK